MHENRNFAPGTNEQAHGRRGTVHIRKYDGVVSQICVRCGAWEGALGLEPTTRSYVLHVVEILREVRRVLRPDGVCLLNVGDTYCSGWVGNSASSLKPKDRCLIPARLGYALQQPWFQCLSCKGLFHGIEWRPDDQGRGICPVCGRVRASRVAELGWYVRDDIAWVKNNPMPASVRDRRTPCWEDVIMLTKSARYWYDAEAIRECPSGRTSTLDDSVGRNARNVIVTSTEPFGYEMCKKCETIYSRREFRRLKKVRVKKRSGRKRAYSGFSNPNSNVGERANSEATRRYARRCKCGSIEFTSHFATFPRKLVEPFVLSCCPASVCQTCGKPRTRIVVGRSKHAFNIRLRDAKAGRLKWKSGYNRTETDIGSAANAAYDEKTYGTKGKRTVRWIRCRHNDYKPGIVLDPFCGTATVGIVAQRLKRDFIGIELSREYCKLARHRMTHEANAPGSPLPPRRRLASRTKFGKLTVGAADAKSTQKAV